MPYIGNPIYQSAFVVDQFNGNGSTTAFTMSVAPAGVTNVLVAVSGVLQDPSTYGVVGNTITFSAAPPSGTGNISCRYLGVPASGVTTTAYRTVTEFTATASQTTFTPPSYTVGFINVYLNGVLLGSADYTASNGTTVVLATGASAGNLLTVESFLVSSVLNAIPNTAGSVSASNLAASGTPSSSTYLRGDMAWASVVSSQWTTTGSDIYYNTGNVGIGTTSPLVTSANRKVVTLNGTTDAMFNIGINGTYTGFFYSSASNTQIGSATSIPLQFYTGDTERMRITSGGNVLVGRTTNTVGAKMCVDGDAGLSIERDSNGYRRMTMTSSIMYFFNGSNEATLSSSGAWTNASDARLKTNIEPIKYGLNTVLETQPRSFNRVDVEGDYIGFVAQELKEKIPEVVFGEEERQYSVDYGSLVAVAFKAIQELSASVDTLNAKVEAQAVRIAELEGAQ